MAVRSKARDFYDCYGATKNLAFVPARRRLFAFAKLRKRAFCRVQQSYGLIELVSSSIGAHKNAGEGITLACVIK